MVSTDIPTRDDERRTLLRISGPLIAAYLAEMGMVITDMLIVGRLGSIELAAVGLGGDWFYVLLLIGIGVLSIVGVLMAQARGAGDALRGLTDTRTPTWTTLVCYWLIGLRMAWWLGFELDMRAQGVWLGMLAGVSSSAVFLIWKFFQRIKSMQADPAY